MTSDGVAADRGWRAVVGRTVRFVRPHLRDIALLVLTAAVAFTLDSRIAERQNQFSQELAVRSEILDNVRFVRETLTAPDARLKPFSHLNLTGVSLVGLPADCTDLATRRQCADFSGSTLVDADLQKSNFQGADFSFANLFRAHISSADFSAANLRSTFWGSQDAVAPNFRGADLSNARFLDETLIRPDLSDATVTEAPVSGSSTPTSLVPI